MAEYRFDQLIDIAQVRQLLESHSRLSGMGYAVLDTDENCLIAVEWQDICTRFHRANPETSARCRESDAYIKTCLQEMDGNPFEYRCKNGLIDVAIPIVIDGEHMATFFTGQFFYEDEQPDPEFFVMQAEAFGFDLEEYLNALERVPIFNRKHVQGNLLFLHNIVLSMAETGLKTLRLACEVAERKRTQKRLALMDFALDHIREESFLIDEEGGFLYVNEGACQRLGYSREELLRLRVADVDPDFLTKNWADHWHTLKDYGSFAFEGRHKTKDGCIFPVEINANYFEYDGQGFNLALARDISDRKRLENEIRSSRDYLFNVINAIADPVFVKDADHRLVLVNDAECALAGCTREELLGRTDYDFFPKEQVDIFWEMDNRVLESGEAIDCEEIVTDAAGRARTVVTHKSRYVDPRNNRFVVGVIRDITERKQMEDALREGEQKYRVLAESLPDNVVRYDRKCRATYFNSRLTETVPIEKEKFLGKTPLEAHPETAETAGLYENTIRRVLTGGAPDELEIVVPHPAGGLRTHLVRIVAERDAEGAITGALAIGRDITEHKQMEEQLRDSEERLRLTLEATRIGIWDWNIEKDEWYASPVCYSLLGYQPKMGLADCHEWLEMVHPDDRAHVSEKLQNVLTRDFYEFEYEARLRHTDGTYRWQYVRGFGTKRGVEGKVARMLGIRMDITERKKAEEVLYRREEEFRALVENAPDFIARYDRECRRVYVNPAMEKLFGRPAQELLGRKPSQQSPLSETTIFEQKVRDVWENGEELQVELPFHSAEGELRWGHFRVVPEFDTDGSVISVLAIARDISAVKEVEKSLRVSEQRFREIFDNSQDCLYLLEVTEDGRFRNLEVNPALERSTGMTRAELIGRYVDETVPEETARTVVAKYRRCVEAGTGIGEESELDLPSGRRFYHSTLVPVRNESGRIYRIVGIARDITERKRMEDALAEREKEFRTLAENTPDVIVRYDRQCRRIYVNPAFERVNHLSPQEALGKTPIELSTTLAPLAVDFTRHLKAVLETGVASQLDLVVAKDGIDSSWFVRLIPESDSSGEVVSALTLWADITERKRMEEANRTLNKTLESRLLALTQPVGDLSSIQFGDLFNIDEMQKVQDAFAQATGVASIITDTQGRPITKPSNFCYLCEHIIRKTEKGLLNCFSSDASLGRMHSKGAVIQRCLSGALWDAGTSISVGDHHIANWLIGQILDESVDEEAILAYARDIGAEEDAFRNALNLVTRMPLQQFEKIADALYLIANLLSKLAIQNVQQARSITEHSKMEEQLRLSEQHFRTLAENSPNIIIRYDLECRRLYVNPSFILETGASYEQLIGSCPESSWLTTMPVEEYKATLRQVMETGIPTRIVVEWPRLDDGRITCHDFHLVVERDPDGQVTGCLAIGHNITALKEAEQQLAKLAETSPGVIFIFIQRSDGSSCMPYVSPRIEELTGLRPEDMASDMFKASARIHPDDIVRVQESIAESTRDLTLWHKEFRLLHPVKGEVWLEGRATPERTSDGGAVAYGFLHDITEHKKLEVELFTARKMEIIGQLAGGVAHEVRNPLNAILSISEALFREKEIACNPEYEPYANHIRTQVGRLSKLMTDLLDLGKPIMQASIKSISLYTLCVETVHLWNAAETAQRHPVVFSNDCASRQLLVRTDGNRFQQVLLNLIENAAQNSPNTSQIQLHIAKLDEQKVAVRVKDAGTGIAPGNIGKIFNPFFSMRKGGTGLGLTLVKHFVESMGGEIRLCNNEPPPGCTAEVVLLITSEGGEDWP